MTSDSRDAEWCLAVDRSPHGTERTLSTLPELVVTATAAYASTNVDGYALLLGFFSNERYCATEIAAGQFASVAAQVAISAAIAQSGWVVQAPFIGLAGVVPLIAGLKRIAEMRRRGSPRIDSAAEQTDSAHGAFGRAATVAAVATSSAIDNIVVYASLLVGRTASDVSWISFTFALLTGVLCLCACATAGSRAPVAALRLAAGRVAPFMTTAIGALLLIRFDTLPWIYSLA